MRLPDTVKFFIKDRLQGLSGSRFIWHLRRQSSCLFLTFDDGPDPENTPLILDVLQAHGVRAVFFLVGENVLQYPDIVQRIAADGHEIGNHTLSHKVLPGLPGSEKKDEILRNQQVLHKVTGLKTFLFRPPQTRLDLSTLLLLFRLRQRVVLWSVAAEDYKNLGRDHILAKVNEQTVSSGDILVFHDQCRETAQVLPAIIENLQAAGFSFGTFAGELGSKG